MWLNFAEHASPRAGAWPHHESNDGAVLRKRGRTPSRSAARPQQTFCGTRALVVRRTHVVLGRRSGLLKTTSASVRDGPPAGNRRNPSGAGSLFRAPRRSMRLSEPTTRGVHVRNSRRLWCGCAGFGIGGNASHWKQLSHVVFSGVIFRRRSASVRRRVRLLEQQT